MSLLIHVFTTCTPELAKKLQLIIKEKAQKAETEVLKAVVNTQKNSDKKNVAAPAVR